MGLAISQRLSRIMGGSISVKSAPGVGSVFTSGITSICRFNGERGMKKILYVEDNDDNVYMLSRRLKRHDYEVLVAADAEQCMPIAEEQQPDLIIMDLKLPGLDGWEATRRLKSNPLTSHIPVIALSASAMVEDRDSALEAGCDDFDTKPVDLTRLLGKIEALVI